MAASAPRTTTADPISTTSAVMSRLLDAPRLRTALGWSTAASGRTGVGSVGIS